MSKFLQQLQALWTSFSAAQKVTVVLTGALVAGGIWGFQRWSVESDFRPLYTDMTTEEAGSVITRLRETGVDYRLNETGTTVLIPSARLAETRLQLASGGLPRHGRIGFELFDQTKFGATEFAEQVNYRRALEGELERSVLTLNQVEQARVHISLPKESIFLDYQQPAKASVVVRLRRSQRLDTEQVRAVSYMVSSAVEGLSPDLVSVLDVEGNLLSRPRRPGKESSGEELELQQKLERETAQKILNTLDPYLGSGKARASVSADVELNAGEQTEEVVDPNPVVINSQKVEEQSQPAWAAGTPGTAANVPRGAATRPSYAGSTLTRKQETSTYQASKTVTHMKLERGAVKRLSVAVIVDNKTGADAAGRRASAPRTPQEMKTIRDLVTAAAGIVESRGDLLTIENLPFETPVALEAPLTVVPAPAPAPGRSPWEGARGIFSKEGIKKYRYVLMGIGLGILAMAALAIVLLRKAARKPKAATPPALPSTEEDVKKQLAEREEAQRLADEAALLDLKMPQVTSNKALILRKVLADSAKKDPSSTVQLLRSWIHEDER